MLAEKQFMDWFMSNGIGIGVPFPMPLVDRLCRNAIAKDTMLHGFLSESFTAHKKNLLVLKFKTWREAFTCYSIYSASCGATLLSKSEV